MINETTIRNELAQKITELNDIETSLTDTVKMRSNRAPMQLKELMKKLSNDLQYCEIIISDHAQDIARVSDDLLQVTASTMRAIHEVLSAIVLVQATQAIR